MEMNSSTSFGTSFGSSQSRRSSSIYLRPNTPMEMIQESDQGSPNHTMQESFRTNSQGSFLETTPITSSCRTSTTNSSQTISSTSSPTSSRYSFENVLPSSLEQEYQDLRDSNLSYIDDVEFHAFIHTLELADVLISPSKQEKEKDKAKDKGKLKLIISWFS